MMRPEVRAAYDLCLFVGCPHPDYLLGADSLRRFERRGLTHRQWRGWLRYIELYPLPHDRQDINVARQRWDFRSLNGGEESIADLIPKYGVPAGPKTDEELRDMIASHNARERAKREAAGG